jgi:hypothetical protein
VRPAADNLISFMPSTRRFPPPWSVVEENNACFIVKDHAGQALARLFRG